MEKTTENQEHQPSQPELDLTQMEPITPKKVIKAEPSFLDRAKGLFAKKDTAESPRFHERKEPTFGQPAAFSAPASELKITPIQSPNTVENATESAVEKQVKIEPTSPKTTVLPVVDSTPAEEIQVEVESEAETTESTESVAISAEKTTSAKSKLTQPENWAIMQKLPPKHRRLFIAIAVGVLVLLALLWLKPSSETVEEIQANQSNSMPIEFQSIDPNQQQQANTAVDNSQAAVTAENVDTQPLMPMQNAVVNNGATNNATMATQAAPQTTAPANNAKSAEQLQAEKVAEQQRREAEQVRLEKLRAEKAAQDKAKAEKLKEEQLAKAKAEKAKAEQQAKATAEKAKTTSGAPVVEAKPAGSNVVSKVPVVEATKAGSNTSSTAKAATKPTTTTAATFSKSLTVPKGVSLMQVFRDNNLNIGDVNAMSKASGAENVLSGFQPGDKVQVSLNSEGRVSTMRLSNGSVFTRQADGSYKFKK